MRIFCTRPSEGMCQALIGWEQLYIAAVKANSFNLNEVSYHNPFVNSILREL